MNDAMPVADAEGSPRRCYTTSPRVDVPLEPESVVGRDGLGQEAGAVSPKSTKHRSPSNMRLQRHRAQERQRERRLVEMEIRRILPRIAAEMGDDD